MRAGRASAVAALFLAVLVSACAGASPPSPQQTASVASTPIPLYSNRPDERRAGKLVYRGGLVLTSPDKRFGGWSDIAVNDDGSEILAISDEAHWLRAHLTYDGKGDLAGMADARIADMLDMDGKPMRGKDGDAEGLTLERPHDLNGAAVVSFERNVRVWRYDLAQGFAARPMNVPIGPWVNALHENQQLEAITLVRPDTLLAFAETKANEGDDILAAFEGYPGGPRRLNTRMASIVPHDPFAVTSAAAMPDGSLLVLERRFSPLGGVGMELRHVPAGEVRAGARMDGEVIANLSFQDTNIDNMEGLAVRQGPRGETILYILSDDNYSPLERTLLLMFELRDGG